MLLLAFPSAINYQDDDGNDDGYRYKHTYDDFDDLGDVGDSPKVARNFNTFASECAHALVVAPGLNLVHKANPHEIGACARGNTGLGA